MIENASEILDPENYRGTQQSFGYREICLKQVQRITNIYSRELTKGFWKRTAPDQHGHQEIVAYISDGRESFINSVECLYDLLMPKFDDAMKNDAKAIQEKIDNKHNEIKERQLKEGGLREYWLKEKVVLMREMFQKLCLLLERLGWLAEETAGED